ncbi:NYN domain-containing protein [Vagococcus xieshaowenii]|uniref:NYN domain-containing protein n=1 Tax=Vagococcus xieshaowenii TaxID=2562451 RepID=A0AAJ5EDZ8_9ENTE|nr:NYN domain-containing protein [Vagococcus xieshaowenii]QCA27892.1 NYN domain-containing protein [Vagococcus xieshaowenii]TFZ39429.1 NYN domain-containing protein [Vagococcus xieshaowenii]
MLKRQLLMVDGYNMIGAWPELVNLKNQDKLADARDALLFELSNYAKFKNIKIIVVFDAQLVPGIQQEYEEYNVTVVFTKTDETADTYIEREASKLINVKTLVTVATSDLAEQWLIFSRGALRKSAYELFRDVEESQQEIKKEIIATRYKQYSRNVPWSLEEIERLERLRDQLSN